MARAAELAARGGIAGRLEALRGLLSPCRLCPRLCGADRLSGRMGSCGAGAGLEVASIVVHRGEEPVLTGGKGVGNVFLAHCNLSCIFCQNHQISQTDMRFPMQPSVLADELLRMQALGCPTVGFVSPTHYAPLIVEAVATAVDRGLDRPLVWNSNGYERVEVLELLEGIFDIYLPDFKYSRGEDAVELSSAPGYPGFALAAISEMHRQAGLLVVDGSGTAVSGLIVRHLVLPNDMAGTRGVLEALARHVSPDVAVSLTAQYNPVHLAAGHPLVGRRLREQEYLSAVAALEELGMQNGWTQDFDSSPDEYMPDFGRGDPFGRSSAEG